MLKANSLLSTTVSVRPPRYQLPRIKSLGSRFLNALVILSLIGPNLTFAAQAAVPSQDLQKLEEEYTSVELSQPIQEEELINLLCLCTRNPGKAKSLRY